MISATEKIKLARNIVQAVEDGRLSIKELKQDLHDVDQLQKKLGRDGRFDEQGVAEDADQVKKVFKDKSGKPVGEIGIDPESSPGNGEWYVHHYATGYSVVGFDSAAEAKRELMYVHKHPDAVEGHPSTKEQGVAEGLAEEFDLIENIIEDLAEHNGVDAEVIWEDLESLTDDELYVFATTTPVMEDWQKVNKKDKTDGMSKKAVNAYRREHPGSKLKTAVTTKPSKLKKGSKASKRRKSYCSRSRGQMKMHNISCQKTPDKAICKARRRWNCE